MNVLKHDVDYCVETVENIDDLNQRLDDLRLTATAALVIWRTKLHLLWMLGAGAVLGWFGFV